jgi:hypothetical protein
VKSWRIAKIMTAMACLGLAATACSSTSTSSTPTTPSATRSSAAQSATSFLGQINGESQIASTVPANGDVNPYGVAAVPASAGRLTQGDILVSNFNDKANVQGTGTTLVEVSPDGHSTLFANISALPAGQACPGGIGLTTALEVLNGGWVVVGSLPTAHGGTVFTGAGCLIVLNSEGKAVETLSGHGINGPWDMAVLQSGPLAELFVSNVLNGTVAAAGQIVHGGTVERLVLASSGSNPPQIVGATTIGSGFAEETNPAALVIGPTGLGLGGNGTLYVADTLANRIAAIPDAASRPDSAGRGLTVSEGGALNGPLGLFIAPDGHILTVNSDDGLIVETMPAGIQVATRQLDSSGSPPGAGALFGLAVAPGATGVYYVDDATNTLDLLH